jgi:hypothetical protein
MMELVSLRLETWTDTTLHVREYCSHVARGTAATAEMARSGEASVGSVFQRMLPNFILIGELLCDF